jgi:hypothetical protein
MGRCLRGEDAFKTSGAEVAFLGLKPTACSSVACSLPASRAKKRTGLQGVAQTVKSTRLIRSRFRAWEGDCDAKAVDRIAALIRWTVPTPTR